MKILVVGAGAIGGYFGGRLLQAGRNVTFLVRPRRAEALAKRGLAIRSRFGDFRLPAPPIVTEQNLAEPFDLILLSCKAFDLESAIAAFAAAVGPQTMILPLLNGMRHLEPLAERFGADRLLGGFCAISSTLDADGVVVHLNDMQLLAFGELDGARSERIERVASTLMGAGFEARLSAQIRQDMWEKWVFIAAAAGIACLMRASTGDIVAAGAADLAEGMLADCAAIARAQGFPLGEASLARIRTIVSTPDSPLIPSMLRDLERGLPVENEQILGDLLRRAPEPDKRSLLRIAYLNVKAYEARREREQASRPP